MEEYGRTYDVAYRSYSPKVFCYISSDSKAYKFGYINKNSSQPYRDPKNDLVDLL